MKKNDPKKPLPRREWGDDDARRSEQERVSRLLDVESGRQNDAAPEPPEPGEVSGMPLDETVPTPVYGMPDDEEPVAVSRRVPVYGLPARANPPQQGTEDEGPTSGRGTSWQAGLFIALSAFALGALVMWWFLT
jgi:hypothetical protein